MNLFPKYPKSAVAQITIMKVTPGYNFSESIGIEFSMDETIYQITKMVSPAGPIIISPCRKDFKMMLNALSKLFFFIVFNYFEAVNALNFDKIFQPQVSIFFNNSEMMTANKILIPKAKIISKAQCIDSFSGTTIK